MFVNKEMDGGVIKEKILVTGAESFSNKIEFKTNGRKSIAKRDEDGNITTKVVEYETNNNRKISDIIANIIFAIYCFFSIWRSIRNIDVGGASFSSSKKYIIFAAVWFVVILIGIMLMWFQGGKNVVKNHGAEHMVVKAYRKLGYIPEISEVRKFSRIDNHCGIGKLSSLITCNLFGFLISYFLGLKISLFIIFVLASIIWDKAPFYYLGLLLQYATTMKPDDENIELALEALRALVESA